jgi:hypothetical protein
MILEQLTFDECCSFNDCSQIPEPTTDEPDPMVVPGRPPPRDDTTTHRWTTPRRHRDGRQHGRRDPSRDTVATTTPDRRDRTTNDHDPSDRRHSRPTIDPDPTPTTSDAR